MTTTTATQTTTYYRLSIELTHHTTPDTRDGSPGESVILADLIATDDETGRRFVYIGKQACGTQGEALDLMAAIYAWERRTGRSFDPTKEWATWAADRIPVELPVEVTVPVKPGTVKVGGRKAKAVNKGVVRRGGVGAVGGGTV